jgi:hypothetical protein
MADDLETLLRDHYSTSAESIQPSPELLEKARSAARFQSERPRLRWRWPILAGAAGVAALSSLLVIALPGGQESTPPAAPAVHATPPAGGEPATQPPALVHPPVKTPSIGPPRPSPSPTPNRSRSIRPSPSGRPANGSPSLPRPTSPQSLTTPSRATP